MKVEVNKVSELTSKAGKSYQSVLGLVIFSEDTNDERCPIRFEAKSKQYKEGDIVELFPSLDYNFHARLGHRLILE